MLLRLMKYANACQDCPSSSLPLPVGKSSIHTHTLHSHVEMYGPFLHVASHAVESDNIWCFHVSVIIIHTLHFSLTLFILAFFKLLSCVQGVLQRRVVLVKCTQNLPLKFPFFCLNEYNISTPHLSRLVKVYIGRILYRVERI